jgi:hypothetical protein
MTDNVMDFPSREPPDDGFSEDHVEELHAEAFRDLENRLNDCVSMAQIAAGTAGEAQEGLLCRLAQREAGRTAYLEYLRATPPAQIACRRVFLGTNGAGKSRSMASGKTSPQSPRKKKLTPQTEAPTLLAPGPFLSHTSASFEPCRSQ